MIVTRFAPSPTGNLHIGGARTALFNWLFARHHGGQFLLRIEDTDRARSTPEATAAIFNGLTWLGLDWDGDAVSQHARIDRHAAVAAELLASGAAYKCFSTPEDITAFREAAEAEGRSTLFRSPWRDAPEGTHPDAPFVVRIRAPHEGEITIDDKVQGPVSWQYATLDDMILLRSDGTPTYMLAVVVDDYDMGVTHVIRGDDHLANAARQALIYHGMGWPLPVYAHIPLIHGPDGKKLSKRHGATSVEDYAAEGYPAPAMRNYLARLGWSHGDDEFFSTDQAIDWFGLAGIGKSPARFDVKKLTHLSGQHMAVMPDAALLNDLTRFLADRGHDPLTPRHFDLLNCSLHFLKQSAKTFPELIEKASFALQDRPFSYDERGQKMLDLDTSTCLAELTPHLQTATWTREALETVLNDFAAAHDMKFGKLAGPLRAALSGRATAPSVFDMMVVLGREESMARITDASNFGAAASH